MKEPCPKCRENGDDASGDNLHRYPDGSAHCFKCRYNEPAGGKRMPRKSKLTVEQVETYPLGSDPSRKLGNAIPETFGVRVSMDTTTGKPDTVYYPYFAKNGKDIVGYKVRGLPKDFSPSVGTIGKNFFGYNLRTKSKRLLITEGEEDCMAAKYMLALSDIDVMSLPNGAKSGVSSLKDHLDWLAEYETIYICLDPDEDGREGTTIIADKLVSLVKQVKIVELDEDIGDISDYHTKGLETTFRALFKGAQLYEPEGIVNGTEISMASLREPLPKGAELPFEGLQTKLHGLRKAEITTVCAGSGVGKSTLVRECTKALIDQGYSVANVALEDQMEVAANALIALDMGIPLPQFRENPPTEAEMEDSYNRMVANGYTYFYKHFAGINSDSLMNKLEYYVKVKGVDYIVLDHLSLVISASESQNERKDIDTLMTKLAKLVVETGVGLVQIVHLKRSDKSFARGDEVELTDLRGSAALEQLSWSVIGLERDQQGDDKDFSRIRLLKNRTWGYTGLCDTVKFDTSTGRMSSVALKPEVIDSDEIEAAIEGKTALPDHP